MRKQTLHPRTAAINHKQKNQSKIARRDALVWLSATFPQIFDNNLRIRPLKLGIMSDILQYADQAQEAGISKSKLREAVVLFTRRLDYLACLKAREMRVDLNGNPVEVVSEEDAERATAKIKKRIEKNIKNTRKVGLHPSGTARVNPSNKFIASNQSPTTPTYAEFTQTNGASLGRAISAVTVKHKSTRQYDPSAVARLKEKLGLSRQASEEIESG